MLHLLLCTDGSLDVCIDSWPGRSKVCMLASSIRAVKQQCLALVSCSQGPKRSRKFLRYTDSHLDRRDEGEEGKVREQCQVLRYHASAQDAHASACVVHVFASVSHLSSRLGACGFSIGKGHAARMGSRRTLPAQSSSF